MSLDKTAPQRGDLLEGQTTLLRHLEQKIDALVAYTKQLEDENSTLKQQLTNSKQTLLVANERRLVASAELSAAIEQLLRIEGSLND